MFVLALDPSATLYLANGSVNIALVVIFVEGLMYVLKPLVDALGTARSPGWTTTDVHDSVVELILLALTAAWGVLLQWAGPVGLHDRTTLVSLIVQIFLALLAEWGIYAKLRGPVPQTPTSSYQQSINTLLPGTMPLTSRLHGATTYGVIERDTANDAAATMTNQPRAEDESPTRIIP